MSRKQILTVSVITAVIGVLVAYTQFTVFVVPPIGAVPEGRTIVISRLNKINFIDSADAMCERAQGGVSLLCRGMMLAAVSKNATIYLRLPYSDWLYSISTGGLRYDR